MKKPHISQIAFSVIDIKKTVAFYKEVFGLDDAGGTRAFRGPDAEKVQGVKDIASTTHWLIDGRSNFQLEFFEFEVPSKLPFPDKWRPCDIGLTRLAFEVRDLDGVLEKGRRLGATQVGEALEIGGRRYASMRDPDGVLIEVAEDAGRLADGRVSRVAGIAASVPSLDVPLRMLETITGLEDKREVLFQKDSLWDLDGAEREAVLIETEGIWIELSVYSSPEPVQRHPKSRLVDVGLSHVAFGVEDFDQYFEVFKSAVEIGLRPNSPEPMTVGRRAAVMYMNDEQGFTYELFHCEPKLYGSVGFTKPSRLESALQHVTSWIALARYGSNKQA